MDTEPTREQFKELCDMVASARDLIMSQDMPGIIEFFTKDGIPLFRLLYMRSVKDKMYKIFVSLHIDLDPIETIHNYTSILQRSREVTMVQCYFKDKDGSIAVGPEAEYQNIQAKAVSFNIDLPIRIAPPVFFKKKAYSNLEEAMHLFGDNDEGKGDVH